MTEKRIVDVKMSTTNGKMIKTTYYSDGSKMVGIVSEKQTDKLLKSVEGMPDLKVMSGFKTKKGAQSGSISYALLVLLVILVWFVTGCVQEDDRCTRPGWHRYDDCYGEP